MCFGRSRLPPIPPAPAPLPPPTPMAIRVASGATSASSTNKGGVKRAGQKNRVKPSMRRVQPTGYSGSKYPSSNVPV